MARHGDSSDPFYTTAVAGGSTGPLFARINADADGDNTVVAAVTGKRIRVLGYAFLVSAAGMITFKSGAATALAEFTAAANGGASYGGGGDAPAFQTAVGEALVVNNPAAVDTNGHLVYQEV